MSALDSTAIQGFDRSMFGGFSGWETKDPDFLATIDVTGDGHLFPDSPRLVCGHFSARTTFSRYPSAQHMTVLREGRSRLLSLWMFWRARSLEDQRPWGQWGDYERKAQQPLEKFLLDPEVSSLTDNATVRSLLWPHPLIPDDGPIQTKNDRSLIRDARHVLRRFAFVDVVDSPQWVGNLESWLQKDIHLGKMNVSSPPPNEFRGSLAEELTPTALLSLSRLNRMDAQLWRDAAKRFHPSGDIDALNDASFAAAIARHSLTLAGVQTS